MKSGNKLNLNASKARFITFSLKNDERLNDLKTVTVGSTKVKKSGHCKYFGVDKPLINTLDFEPILKWF